MHQHGQRCSADGDGLAGCYRCVREAIGHYAACQLSSQLLLHMGYGYPLVWLFGKSRDSGLLASSVHRLNSH